MHYGSRLAWYLLVCILTIHEANVYEHPSTGSTCGCGTCKVSNASRDYILTFTTPCTEHKSIINLI